MEKKISDILPHKYPFLLVDKIIEYTPGVSATCLKNVTINEPYFQGHFPTYPVMPGVLIIEAMAQAAGVASGRCQGQDTIGVLAEITKAKLRKPVQPGDTLILKAHIDNIKMNVIKSSCTASVDGIEVANCCFTVVITQ